MTPDEFIKRQKEIIQATATYPGLEVGEAYRKWKAERGEEATMLQTADESLKASETTLRRGLTKPCDQPGCGGMMWIESVCGGCVEGKAGFRSKWICDSCFFRTLHKEDYFETVRRMIKEAEA